MLLTTAAYLFRDTQAFEELTKAMILPYRGSYMDIPCDDDFESAMTCKVLCKFPNNKTERPLANTIVRHLYLRGNRASGEDPRPNPSGTKYSMYL
jgi:hypothetical protein